MVINEKEVIESIQKNNKNVEESFLSKDCNVYNVLH
jgi:hypothetical protein